MTGASADSITPHIQIDICQHQVRVTQHRPPLVSSLVGMTVTAALQLVPVLLPVCGRAQAVAARRAVAAARGTTTTATDRGIDEQELWREQAFAAAWRFCIDWHELLGEPRRMVELAAVRGATDDAARSEALGQLIVGLDCVQSIDQLLTWAQSSECIAARVARLALEPGETMSGSCLGGDALADIAVSAFARQSFDALAPWTRPLEVGPLAMARDPLVSALRSQLGNGIAARVFAQVLDTRVICRQLAEHSRVSTTAGDSWSLEQGMGMGRAITSRGPVFHRVKLQADCGGERVADWRVIAPTDWHFAPQGPVVAGLKRLYSADRMRLLVTSYDPCVPWTLQTTAPEA